MNFCSILLFLGAFLAVIVVVGHGIWVVLASVFRALSGQTEYVPSRTNADREIACVSCGRSFLALRGTCPQCGLNNRRPEVKNLRKLETTRDQILGLLRTGELLEETGATVLRAVDRRREELLGRLRGREELEREVIRQPAARRTAPPAAAAPHPDDAAPELAQMEEILGAHADVRQMPAELRQRGLALYRKKPPDAWARLSSPALLALARLLSVAGLASRALHLYQVLLTNDPRDSRIGEAAVEAARLADSVGATGELAALLDHALTLSLTAEERSALEALQAKLRGTATPDAAQEEIPVVQAAAQSPPSAGPPVSTPVIYAQRVAEPPAAIVLEEEPPAPPRRTFGEMMAAFMEERNILWGELVGGLLIVGCSIALVLSLREQLQEIPYFPFVMVSAVTAALIGAGRYTLSHWKLESTSRGLLVIGTMMVPLCFMVLAGLVSNGEHGTMESVTEVIAVVLFTWLVRGAANILVRPAIGPLAPRSDWLATLAIVGASASLLLVPYIERIEAAVGASGLLGLIGYAPAACFAVTQAIAWYGVYRREGVSLRQVGGLFLALGLSIYALAAAFGFVLYWTENIGRALEYLAVPVALAGLPLLLGGTIATARLPQSGEAQDEEGSLPLGVAAVLATMLSLGGALVMLLALAAAWPDPPRLTAIAAVNALVLSLVAWRFRLGPVHVPAQICLVVAVLTGYHALAGHLDVVRAERARQLLHMWFSPTSGVVLIVLAALLAMTSEWQARLGRLGDSKFLASGAGAIALASLVLVLFQGATAWDKMAPVYATAAVGAWLVNMRWQLRWLTAAGALAFWIATMPALRLCDGEMAEARLLTWSLLIAAAVALLLAMAVEWMPGSAAGLRQAFVVPLHGAAYLASTAAALSIAAALEWGWLGHASLATLGVGCIWLALAWRHHNVVYFAGFQILLVAAVLLGTVGVLESQSWFTRDAVGLLGHLRSWQAYGAGLSALALAWVAARFALVKSARAWALVELAWTDFLALDRLLLVGLVLLAVVVSAVSVIPGVVEELLPFATASPNFDGYPPLAWCWLTLLFAALVLVLWQEQVLLGMACLTAVLLCMPVTGAAGYAEDLAVASALRWGLALSYLLGSALVWWRSAFARWAHAGGIRCTTHVPIATVVRLLLLAGALLPVLFLAFCTAMLGFAGLESVGPLAGSFFANLGPLANLLLPLVVVCVALAGHGMREGSAGYAFSAGLVALAAGVGGHALAIIEQGGSIGAVEWVQLGQLVTGLTAAWLLAWLGVRRVMSRRWHIRGAAGPLPCEGMLAVQEVLTWVSYILWLAPALVALAAPVVVADADTITARMESGSWLGWIAVALAIVAGVALRLDATSSVSSWFIATAAMLVAGVLCCTVTIFTPDWDQRTLMLASAALALVVVLTLVRWSEARPGAWLVTSAGATVELVLASLAGGLAIVLALWRAAAFNDHYWAAAAVVIVASAAAAAALLRRGEAWMFVSNLLALLATTLVLNYHSDEFDTVTWRVLLAQANLITAAVVGMLWLYYLKHISDVSIGAPWLCVQQTLIFFGSAALLLLGFRDIVTNVATPDDVLTGAMGLWPGWLALAAVAVSNLWFLRVVLPAYTLDGLMSLGLKVGVLVACTASVWDSGDGWLAHHVLPVTWLLSATGLLAAARQADRQRSADGAAPWWTGLVPRAQAIGWVMAIGLAVTLLACASGWDDPYRPVWPGALVLAVSVLMGALTLWTGRGEFVYASGVLFNAIGFLMWLPWYQEAVANEALSIDAGTNVVVFDELQRLVRFFLVQILCLALASLVWSAVELGGGRLLQLPALVGNWIRYRHLALWVALGAFCAWVAYLVSLGLIPKWTLAKHDWLIWIDLAALAVAVGVTFWDSAEERWASPLPQLYALGLAGLGSFLHLNRLDLMWHFWTGTICLGPYALLASLACWGLFRFPRLGEELGMPPAKSRPLTWYLLGQTTCAVVVTIYGLWICLIYWDAWARLGGFLTVACLVPAAALAVPHWQRLMAHWQKTSNSPWDRLLFDDRLPRYLTLLLGVLACGCLHLIFISPADRAPWLERSVWLMAAVTWMSALYGLVLPRVPPAGNLWAQVGRRIATPLGLLACAFLVLVLVQEFFLYDVVTRTTPLTVAGAVVVAVALAVLVGGALVFALLPQHDLLQLSERGRTLYVYAAEALVVLLLFHLRLNLPDLDGLTKQYWVFVVMGLAYLGVGLSELCQRRGLRVLADPLQRTAMFLPLFPLLAFLVRPYAEMRAAAGDVAAGMQPWLRYLDRLPADYRWHATLWFLVGLLYVVVALSRRSSNLALVAAVLANFGLWVLFGAHDGLSFVLHPQLWLIPIGIIVLVAEHLKRKRLQPPQALALRYAGLLLIYVSSAADMFISGLGQSVLLPIALALMAVAGVLLGILLRVRAFLLLGMTFLFLVVFAQIWHAAVDRSQTWVWWASGIVLGVAILVLFALFEKRRNDVVKVIDDLKRWR